MSSKVISVIGATGVQGGSVVDALLDEGEYSIRAITRNPNSNAAKELAAKGVTVVTADVNDLSSLIPAFSGSHAIYAVTDFFEPFTKHGPAKAMEIEAQQGINLAKAASATSSLEHYIWSTLPNGSKVSGGKYKVPHFEAKNKVDEYIKSNANLYAKTTFLWVTYYAQNYYFPMFTPIFVPTSGQHIQIHSTPASVPIKSIGDARANIGLFVKAIFQQPKLTLPGKYVLAHVEDTTAGKMLQAWADAQGKKSQYLQTDKETYYSIWPKWAEEMGLMMQFWNEFQEESWSGEDGILTKEELGIHAGLVGLKEAFAVLNFD